MVRACTHDISALTFSRYDRGDTFPVLECAPGHVHLAFIDDPMRNRLVQALTPDHPRSVALEMFKSGRLGRRIREDGYAAFDRTMHTKDPGKTSTLSVPLQMVHGRLAQLSINFFASALSVPEAVERYLPDMYALARTIATRWRSMEQAERASQLGTMQPAAHANGRVRVAPTLRRAPAEEQQMTHAGRIRPLF